jgi:aminoglycoside phosphotransferase
MSSGLNPTSDSNTHARLVRLLTNAFDVSLESHSAASQSGAFHPSIRFPPVCLLDSYTPNNKSNDPALGSRSFFLDRICLSWGRRFMKTIFGIWNLFPNSLRVAFYGFLWRLGSRLYPNTGSYCVKKVLPGCYLKMRGELENERDTLTWIESYTRLSAPRVLDFARKPPSAENLFVAIDFLLISELPGKSVMEIREKNLTQEDLVQLSKDLRLYFEELRSYQSPWADSICSIRGSSLRSWRVQTTPFGPFEDERAFNAYLSSRACSGDFKEIEHKVQQAQAVQHRLCFSHGDLSQSNVTVHKGRLSGVVDWECVSHRLISLLRTVVQSFIEWFLSRILGLCRGFSSCTVGWYPMALSHSEFLASV